MGENYLTYEALRERGIVHNRTTLRRNILFEGFPKPVKISARRIAFLEKDVEAWLESRIAGNVCDTGVST